MVTIGWFISQNCVRPEGPRGRRRRYCGLHDGRLRSRRRHVRGADFDVRETSESTPARRRHLAPDDGRRARSAVLEYLTAIGRRLNRIRSRQALISLLATTRRILMIRFDAYRERFPNARHTRSKRGVLEVALHTDGRVLVFNGHTHEQFVDLFHAIGSDPDNRVVILTGRGDAFMETIAPDGFDFFTPRGYDKIYREGKRVLMNILDIEVPMIAAVNGPVRLHSEYILLCDIVLATPSTVFQDKPHFELGIATGDGVNLLWQETIGTIRGRYFILTRQELDVA